MAHKQFKVRFIFTDSSFLLKIHVEEVKHVFLEVKLTTTVCVLDFSRYTSKYTIFSFFSNGGLTRDLSSRTLNETTLLIDAVVGPKREGRRHR